jgi:hypothetical protein
LTAPSSRDARQQNRWGVGASYEASIPGGDMLLILAAKGSTKSAFGIHGLTAVLMVLAAIPMMIGAP